jgi:CRP-like cAMP-binding protein
MWKVIATCERGNEMSLVIDTLRTSSVTDGLSDDEVQMIEGLFDVQEYKSGEVIVQPGDARPDNLYILAHGDIEVRIASGNEESTIHVLKPGDLAGIITFVGGAASDISATLYAVGKTKVLSMARVDFEKLINSHPMIVYKVMRGVARNMHSVVRRANSQSTELMNYIYHANGRY